MAMQQKTLSNRTVAALQVAHDTVFWDRHLTGFGVRVYPSGGKIYVAQARAPGGPGKPNKPKRVRIGRHGVISADEARKRAALIIARIKAGEEPVPLPLAAKLAGGPTVGNLGARFLDEHVGERVKPKTAANARTAVRRHILPALGRLRVQAVERTHVLELQQKLSDRPSQANTVVKTLSHMYDLGVGWGLVPEGCNPCRGIAKYPERKRERFLTDAEFARLSQVLDEAVASGEASPIGVAAIRLLILTGCRKNEILSLRWKDVDLDAGELRLADAKTGPRTVQLPPLAVQLLESLPPEPDRPWVFPGRSPETHLSTIYHLWLDVRAKAGLEDVRLHDLRHSFASRALALGETLPVIGKLLGHSDIETTARYAHLEPDSLHKAAERIAGSIAIDIL